MFAAYPVGKQLAAELGQYYRVSDWMQGHSNFFKAVAMEKKVMFLILSLIVAVAAFAGRQIVLQRAGRTCGIDH